MDVLVLFFTKTYTFRVLWIKHNLENHGYIKTNILWHWFEKLCKGLDVPSCPHQRVHPNCLWLLLYPKDATLAERRHEWLLWQRRWCRWLLWHHWHPLTAKGNPLRAAPSGEEGRERRILLPHSETVRHSSKDGSSVMVPLALWLG